MSEKYKNWPNCRNNGLTGEQILLITLGAYAIGGILMTLGDGNGVSISSVSKAVGNVTHCRITS